MSNITSVVLGEGVAAIGTSDYNTTSYCPFNGCTGIKEVTFKGTAVPTRYPADIFCSMNALETVYVPAESYSAYVNALSAYVNNGRIVAIGNTDDFVISDGVLTLYTGEGGDIEIPAGVESIGASAFQNCTTITSVKLNNELKSIGSRAFQGCSALVSVEFNDNVDSIGNIAFKGCTELTGKQQNDGMDSIGSYAFGG